ncbi:MAG: hypothetical protein D6724_11105 [Armatimonadetes bacterium]|nr:MAG: hypothetical protein D6724_11105 [Armatimonadota bacterium]
MANSLERWWCVILAGGAAPDEIAQRYGVSSKADVSFGGRTSLERVVEACQSLPFGRLVAVVGDEARSEISGCEVRRAGRTNIESALSGVEGAEDSQPCLFLPCDLPLLDSSGVQAFVEEVDAWARPREDWFAVGLCPSSAIKEAFPDVPYRFLRFREGRFASGGYYAGSAGALRRAAETLGLGSRNRRAILKLAVRFGVLPFFRYLLGQVTVAEAAERAGRALGAACLIVTDADPFSTLDFDTLKDVEAIERLLSNQ